MSAASLTLADLERAAEIGSTLDLTGCIYGPAHGSAHFLTATYAYYAFLAGFVRDRRVRRIAELGTHYGGSTLSMRAGLVDPGASKIVTVDVTRLNVEGMAPHPQIHRLTGDALAPEIVDAFVRAFDDGNDTRVDLLYVDTVHSYRQTLESVSVYANRLKPRVIILDDTRLNRDMRRLWSDLHHMRVGTLLDASDAAQRTDAGFGVIDCAEPARWPESSPRVRVVRRAMWAGRRTLGVWLPDPIKHKLRALIGG